VAESQAFIVIASSPDTDGLMTDAFYGDSCMGSLSDG
jgi:hypothetical protein